MKKNYILISLILFIILLMSCSIDYAEDIVGKWKYIIPSAAPNNDLQEYRDAYGLTTTNLKDDLVTFEEYGFTSDNKCYYKLYQFGVGTSGGATPVYWIGTYKLSDQKITITIANPSDVHGMTAFTTLVLTVDIGSSDLSLMTITNKTNKQTKTFHAIE